MFFLDEYNKRVKECGDAPVLTDRDGKRTLTYREFDRLTDQITGKLIKNGVQKGTPVIVILPRCSEYIAAEVALLRLGAVVIPLIPTYPSDRVEYIKKDCGAVCFIKEDFFDDLENEEYAKICDGMQAEPAEDSSRAMILYTSGSTGYPKGVVYSRHNIDMQVIRKCDSVKGIEPLVFAASATMSFCVTITEYYRAMVLGGHVHMLSEEVRSDVEKMADYFAQHQITSAFISPRILKNFESKSSHLQRVFTASEKVVNICSDQFEIRNCYGQSETAGSVTEFCIERPFENTPIGKPLQEVRIIIVDADDQPVADGEEGQICIIGDLPCEYNNLPEQTEKTFRILPDGQVCIYTGDIGKILPDGNLLYLNRNDWMIKIHGQRVEPGEIESVMNKVKGITGSIVKAFENEDGTMLVCGFYTANEPVDKLTIKETLEKKLPHYMIPGTFIKMDAFPVNPNGKIDRKSIKRPDLAEMRTAYEEPKNETEKALCQAMEKLLKIDQIGRNDNFMELGGNSINAVTLCADCDIKGLAPQIVMIGQTPAGIAKLMEEKSFCEKPELEISGRVRDTYPLSFSQRYQYDVCHTLNTPIDVIDMEYYFHLDTEVDVERLKKAVADVVNEHPIYQSHIDIEQNLLLTAREEFSVKEVAVGLAEFKEYRDKRYRRVRDYRKDPLFEAEIIRVDDGSMYLFLCLCHFIYDGKSLKNLVGSIEAKYNNKQEAAEKASIFDLIDYEDKLRADKDLIRNAMQVFEENYRDLAPANLFGNDKKYNTAHTIPILEGISQEEIDEFLKRYSISILTLLECAMELAVEKLFEINDFCYMNVYDGRANHLLSEAHGVFAKSVFVRARADQYSSLKEHFEKLKEQYQKLVYFDVVNSFDIVEKYPAVRSGITFNYRELLPLALKLGEKRCMTEFMTEFFDVNKPFTALDIIINKLPQGYGYNITIASAEVPQQTAVELAGMINETVKKILKGEIA